MKTNRSIRGIRKIQFAFFCLATAALLSAGLALGDSSATHQGRRAVSRGEVLPPPTMDLSVLVTALR